MNIYVTENYSNKMERYMKIRF